MKIKINKNIFFFIFGKDPTRFDLAPSISIRSGESRLRSSLDKIVC